LLVKRGLVGYKDLVDQYLKRWHLKNDPGITIEQLLNHSAGINQPGKGYWGYPSNIELPNIIEVANGDERINIVPKREFPDLFKPVDNSLQMEPWGPGKKWSYSSGGYVILQILIEDLTGVSFEEFCQENIFKPLKMTRTTFDFSKATTLGQVLPPYRNKQPATMYIFVEQSTAGLYTCLRDFTKFVQELINPTLLSNEEIDHLRYNPLSGPESKEYGLGFMINDNGMGHRGTNLGWKSQFYVNRKNKTAIIYL